MWSELLSAAVLLVAVVFAAAALAKATAPARFRDEIRDYELLPVRLVPVAAVLVPSLEVAGAALAFVPATRALGAAVLLVLLAGFTGAVALNLRRGRTEIACACFGARSQRLSWLVPVRNTVLAVALAGGLVAGLDASPGVGAVVAAGLAAVLVWSLLELTHVTIGLRET